jgi:GNAT superfamily N-acetyltransferase
MATKKKRSQTAKKRAAKTVRSRFALTLAVADDVTAIKALRNSTAEKLTAVHGRGNWSGHVSDKGVLFTMRNAKVFVARQRKQIMATITLSKKKPWAIDTKYFTKSKSPLYLTAMAITPQQQGKGLGRKCLAAVIDICKDSGADAIRLDAYDAAGGAGGFYQKCGFREVGRASYRDTPLIYYEMLL